MLLSFKEKFADGSPTYFLDGIWNGLIFMDQKYLEDYNYFIKLYFEKFGDIFQSRLNINQKIHTIREDKYDKWEPGMDIHFCINPRSKNYFQFAPVMKCISVQKFQIVYNKYNDYVIFINDSHFKNIKLLTRNDGFDSIQQFFKFFNKDFSGKIIHWTNYKY